MLFFASFASSEAINVVVSYAEVQSNFWFDFLKAAVPGLIVALIAGGVSLRSAHITRNSSAIAIAAQKEEAEKNRKNTVELIQLQEKNLERKLIREKREKLYLDLIRIVSLVEITISRKKLKRTDLYKHEIFGSDFAELADIWDGLYEYTEKTYIENGQELIREVNKIDKGIIRLVASEDVDRIYAKLELMLGGYILSQTKDDFEEKGHHYEQLLKDKCTEFIHVIKKELGYSE